MKKFLSLALALMMIVSLFAMTSCEKEPKEQLEAANKALTEKPYTMTMKMNLTADNSDVQEILDAMNVEVPVTIDGNNMFLDMTMDMMGQSVAMKMTLVDKVLYYNMDLAGMAMKMKATLNDEQLADFVNKNGAEMPVDYTMFAELKSEKKDGKTVITCTGINDEGKKALNDELASSLGDMGKATVGDLSYNITLKDGKYESMDLSCTYTVTVSGVSVSVTMKIGATFAYDKVAAVTAPADAAEYKEVDYSEMMG